MTDPITPPDELQRLWAQQAQLIEPRDPVAWMQSQLIDPRDPVTWIKHVSAQAAQWGADQELEACCEWTQSYAECGDALRLARRPKPPSLKEQALEAAQRFYAKGHESCTDEEVKDDFDAICRALEALDD